MTRNGSEEKTIAQSDDQTAVRMPRMRNITAAVEFVQARFPFQGYMDKHVSACVNISKAIIRHLPPARNTRILDFGCGPCDVTAVLSTLGYECSGYDDLQDDWHRSPGNRETITKFTAEMGIDFRLAIGSELPWGPNTFALVMLNDVVEHLHNSPRTLLNNLLRLVKGDGFLLITVPNAVNIRKRFDVLFGRTNYPPFDQYYWYPDPWRGHIREYTRGDLRLLSKNLDLSIVELQSCDHMLYRVPAPFRLVYLALTGVFRGWKDSWLLMAKKTAGWQPSEVTRTELSRRLSQVGVAYWSSSQMRMRQMPVRLPAQLASCAYGPAES